MVGGKVDRQILFGTRSEKPKFYLAPGMRNEKIYLAPNYTFEKFYLAVKGLTCNTTAPRYTIMSSVETYNTSDAAVDVLQTAGGRLDPAQIGVYLSDFISILSLYVKSKQIKYDQDQINRGFARFHFC